MTDLRKHARDKPCMIRLPGVCNFNPATTVLAHLNGGKSLSSKNPDILGAWACSACHDAVDRRRYTGLDFDYVTRCHLEGVARTIRELVKEGIIKW